MFDTSSSSLFLFFKGLDSKCVLIRNCTAAGSCFMCCSLGAETLHSKLWKNTSYANDVVEVKLVIKVKVLSRCSANVIS